MKYRNVPRTVRGSQVQILSAHTGAVRETLHETALSEQNEIAPEDSQERFLVQLAFAWGSDGDSQCWSGYGTAIRFTETVALEGLVASIGGIGNAYDNAAGETVMGLYKNEAVAKNSPFWVGPLKTIADIRRSLCPIVGRAAGLQAAIAFE